MNCKLKPHSKGLNQPIFGAITLLKFLQTLALDVPRICPQCLPGNFSRQEEKFIHLFGRISVESSGVKL